MAVDLKAHSPVGPTLKFGRDDRVDRKLIIGLDFGTTYTGQVAWGITSDPKLENIKVVNQWPGKTMSTDTSTVKVPSVMAVLGEKDIKWGYEASDLANAIRTFKLTLEPERHNFYPDLDPIFRSIDDIAAKEITTNKGYIQDRRVERLVSKYIGAVYQHALKKIVEQELDGHAMKLTKAFVITVPAVWSDKAKCAMLRAVRRAHDDLKDVAQSELLLEPEAAVIYTLERYKLRGVENDDSFVVCDAGGGTVDVISYKVTAVAPRLRIQELTVPTGGAIGSIMLNDAFLKCLPQDVLVALKAKTGALEDLMRIFDRNVKPGFTSAADWDLANKDQWISLGVIVNNNPQKYIHDNKLRITGAMLDGIFRPLADQTAKLVEAQIQQARQKSKHEPKAVFLVGGFGASPYLLQYLTARVNPIKVINPQEAWSAVARGAVLHRMPTAATVDSKVAPSNLGVRANMPLVPQDDPTTLTSRILFDEKENIRRVPKMTWYILKHTELFRDRKVVFKFYRDLPLNFTASHLIFDDALEESNFELPPVFPWHDDKLIKKCHLRTDFGALFNMPRDKLTKRKDRVGTEYYSVYYDLLVTIGSAAMTFSAEWEGRQFAVQDLKYDLS